MSTPAIPLPSDSQRCTAIAKTGNRCKRYALPDDPDQRCSAHTLDPERQTLVARDPVRAAHVSAAAKRRRKEEREYQAYVRTLSAKEQLQHRLAMNATRVVDELEAMLDSDDPDTKLKAIKFWYEHVHGKAVTPVVKAETQLPPGAMTLEELEALPLEVLAAMARGEKPTLEQGGYDSLE